MSTYTARCAELRKAQIAFYAAADKADASPADITAQDAYAAALTHLHTIGAQVMAEFPGMTMAEARAAAGF